MKTFFTLFTTCLIAAPALAHPGHDHAGAPGGEQHHLLWIGLAIAAIAAVCLAVSRRARSRRGTEKSGHQ